MAESSVIFLLKSVVRGKTNRAQRWLQPGRTSWVQKFAGGSITVRRARPARITEAALLANIEEIKRAVAADQIVVTTLSGEVIDLATLQSAPAAPSRALPNPPLDSAQNDKNAIGYRVPPTPEGTTDDAPEPELLKRTPLSEPPPAADTTPEPTPALLAPEAAPEASPEASEESEGDEDEESSEEEAEPQPEQTPASPSATPAQPRKKKKHGKGKRG